MTDTMPNTRNPGAVWISRIINPYLLPLPTTLILLNGLPPREMLGWTLLVMALLVVPGVLFTLILRRRGSRLYRRGDRLPLFIFGWICVVICLGVVLWLNGPLELVAGLTSLVLWIPLQGAINQWVTKVSGHAAVATGCFLGLLLAGKLISPLVIGLLFGLLVLTLWARVVTDNHSVKQVLLGVLVGAIPVLIVFPVILG